MRAATTRWLSPPVLVALRGTRCGDQCVKCLASCGCGDTVKETFGWTLRGLLKFEFVMRVSRERTYRAETRTPLDETSSACYTCPPIIEGGSLEHMASD